MTPFEVLGVSPDSTKAQLKAAYRRLAQRWHPDKCKDPQAPARFREAKEAYDLVKNGTYTSPAPSYTYQPPKPPPATVYPIIVTFEETFEAGKARIPGTDIIIKVPYGVRDGDERIIVGEFSSGLRQSVRVRFTVRDPQGFFYIKRVDHNDVLHCTLQVSSAALLSRQKVRLRNINPEVAYLSVTLDPETQVVKVPHGGLENPAGGRDPLYVVQSVTHKPLEQEDYHVLLALQDRIATTLAEYKSKAFR